MRIDDPHFFGIEGGNLFCKEAWAALKPLLTEVLRSQTSIGSERQLIYLRRKGFLEECYFDYNLGPMVVGDSVEGVYCTFIDSTKRVLDQRRLNLLTQLLIETHKSHSIVHACETVTNILNRFREDVPFTLTYILKIKGEKNQLCSPGVDENLEELFRVHTDTDEIKYIENLAHSVSKAVLIPIKSVGQVHPFCMVIFGISPTLELNDDYKEFHILLSRFLSTILSKIQMIESKQKDVISRDEFISIASHEFKTPITALKLRLALTKRKINLEKATCPTPQEMSDCLKTADQQADRLLSLVDELLDMTRIQRGKFQFVFEEMHLHELIEEVLNRFEDELQKYGHQIYLNIPRDLKVNWHKSRFDQVLTNLITNTVKYAPGASIWLSASRDSGKVKIEYSDDGPGIEADKLDRIFERFEGGHTSERVGGLGLGLYIVREIIKGHGGFIEVKSKKGEGSKFVLSVPISP